MKISSLQNPKVKLAKSLMDRRDRDEKKLFLIEGYRELKRAVDAHLPLQTLFYCPKLFLKTNEKDLIEKAKSLCPEVLECDEGVFEKLSYRDRPDGLLAIAPKMQKTLIDLKKNLSKSPFIIVAVSIEKPGNLGTILRSGDAAGIDGVIVCDPKTDIHNPNVVRASVGTLFTLPVIEATSQETLAFLTENKISIVASTPHAKDNFFATPLKGPIAILVGSEQYGLEQDWFDRSEIKVRIPMHGIADSLNAAQAATLLLYEALRQRKYD